MTTTHNANGAVGSIDDFVEAATEYAKLGWVPVPLRDGKNPNFRRWPKFEFSETKFREKLAGAEEPGVGGLFGPRSRTVDFEYDTPAQREKLLSLFPDNAPPIGAQFKSKKGEHWLFQWDERLEAIGKAVLEIACDDGTKLILRIGAGGKGAQSALPPSRNKAWKTGLSPNDCPPAKLPDYTIARLLEYAEPKKRTASTNGASNNGQAAPAALAAMLRHKPSPNENDGSNRLLAICCRAVEHDLGDATAVATIRQYEQRHPFPANWSDDDVIRRLRDAEKKAERGSAIVIANYEAIEVEGDDGKKKTVNIPRSMGDIIDTINARMGDWPRRVDSMLFVDDPKHGLDYFDRRTTAGLFGWLRRHCKVTWNKGGSLVSQAELFAEIERTTQRYEAIELLPHEPPIANTYYRGVVPKPGDGSHLRKLLNRFRPETTIDRDLIQAAMMTSFWGGLPGCRPAFVVTSDDGRGVGKSKVPEVIALLCGGAIDVSANEDIAALKSRLLSPDARTKRIALLDNVKTLRLSWAELEAMITSPIISGKQMYVGEGQRPNLLTWFITLNGVSMATDMAQRSVIIKVTKGKNDGPWWEHTRNFINQHRNEIIGDIIAALRAKPFSLPQFTRWATWEQHVLQRLPEPGEAQRVILERQGEANCELDEAEIVEEFFAEQLRRLAYDPPTAQVRIPVAIAGRWFNWATGSQEKTAAISKRLHQMAGERQLKQLKPDASRYFGRCFIWTGINADVIGDPICNDLSQRLAEAQSHE